MNNYKLIDLVKNVLNDPTKLPILEDICELCENFRYSYSLDEMVESLYNWLKEKYQIHDMVFSLFDAQKNINCIIFKQGKEFFLDDEKSFYFIIDTKTEQKATISFCAKDTEHFKMLKSHEQYLEILFFQITPVLQSALLKKLYLEHSSIDTVTNVYNRKYLLDHIHKKIALSNETEDNITFLMVGIDRFKAVIDEFDYDIGDKVLVELARVIHSKIKSHDIVARLTGDEFLVALLHVHESQAAVSIALEIIQEFAKSEITVNEDTKQVLKKTACIGISSYPQDSNDIEAVIKNADRFLEEARNKGRSSYAFYEPEEESSIDLF